MKAMMTMMVITAMLYGRFDKNRAKGVADSVGLCVRFIHIRWPTQIFVFFLCCILHFSAKMF